MFGECGDPFTWRRAIGIWNFDECKSGINWYFSGTELSANRMNECTKTEMVWKWNVPAQIWFVAQCILHILCCLVCLNYWKELGEIESVRRIVLFAFSKIKWYYNQQEMWKKIHIQLIMLNIKSSIQSTIISNEWIEWTKTSILHII